MLVCGAKLSINQYVFHAINKIVNEPLIREPLGPIRTVFGQVHRFKRFIERSDSKELFFRIAGISAFYSESMVKILEIPTAQKD